MFSSTTLLLLTYLFCWCICDAVTPPDLRTEDMNETPNSQRIAEDGCIGQIPKNGWVESTIPPLRKLKSDYFVDHLTSVAYKCKDNHFTDGSSVNTCFEGKWISDVPECKPYCNPTEISSASIVPTMCSYYGVKVQCTEPAAPGTIALIKCRQMYKQESSKSDEQVAACGADGAWTPKPQDCTIICGIVGSNATKTPWNVYFSYGTWRGFGTIINARMVLSVAEGFWNGLLQQTEETPEIYVNIVRKKNYFQTIGIEKVVYAPNHNKFIEYPTSGNIVVIILRTRIEFNSDVVPICLPFELNGAVDTSSCFTGQTPQQDNLTLQLPSNCYSEWNEKRPRTAIDEICTNLLNISEEDIRPGSSFAVRIPENGIEVFYLFGLRTWTRRYNQRTYFRFQNVLYYKDFLQKEIYHQNGKNFAEENATSSRFSDDKAEDVILVNEHLPCGVVAETDTRTPWNVRIENEITKVFRFGAIINPRLVLTFAEIVWNVVEQKTYDFDQLYVTVTRKNIIHQQIEVERIAYAPNHRKSIKFPNSGNIAAVILRSPIHFNSAVAPICLPFEAYPDGVLPNSLKGRTLPQDDVELQHPQNCYSEMGNSKPLATIDVLCTNLLNGVDIQSGSSFVVPIKKNGTEVFYLIGLQTWHREYNQGTYFQFQNVLFYKEFIQKETLHDTEMNSVGGNISRLDVDSVSTTSNPEQQSITCGKISQNITKTPWNVRVEFNPIKKYTPGTIINDRMVLSLAYNFLDRLTRKAYDLSNIYVNIVINNIVHQEIEIERVAFAPNYSKFASTPPSGNIVVIVLRTTIDFKSYIQPICLPFQLYADSVTHSSFDGRTPQQDSIVLQSPANCFSELNPSEKPLIAKDVLCTKQLKLTPDDIEFGSSFTIPIKKDGIETFHLIGMRMWIDRNDDGIYFEFQNVLFYKDFIESEIAQEKEKNSQIFYKMISTSAGVNTSYCRADNIPSKGNAYFESTNQRVEFGEIIRNSFTIVYQCIENHILFGDPTNVCLDGEWIFSAPDCKPRCNPKEIQGWTVKTNCQLWQDNTLNQISCTEPAVPGTIAVINCESGYERFISNQQTTTCGSDGRWSPLPEKCTTICGRIGQGAAFIVGGQTSEISNNPWHAGIYLQYNNKTEQVCGGSIISAKIVISAAHCFWDPTTDGIYRKEEYIVAVGKSLRQFNATESFKPQYFKIDKIFYEETYNDYAGNYANDIAVVVLNQFIEFKSYIAPVCIAFGLEYDDRKVQPGLVGRVAGWGVVQVSGKPSPVLKQIEVPVVSRKECREKSTMEYRPFITSDKFCAGYLTGGGVCRGDSGGGLVFPQSIGSKTVYFLRGIVSSGATVEGSCEKGKYTAFTSVAYYSDFVEKLYLEYDPQL